MMELISPWPGELVNTSVGEIFVRTAPAEAGGEPALFVHGLGGSSRNWTDLMDLLRQPSWGGVTGPELACEAVDLPGFGYSPPAADGNYSIGAHVSAVIALIEQRKNWPVHLVGNSLGGAVSTRVAARRPDLVRTLTLISPALPDLRPRLLPLRLAVFSAPGIGTWMMRPIQRLASGGFWRRLVMTSVKGISSHVNQLKMNVSNRPLAGVQRTHCADTQQARPVGSRRDSARS